jgi:RNA polymerase sigma-70 factor (ECF subfamily)
MVVVEGVFEQSYQASRRLAAVRAAAMVSLCGLPQNSRPDLEQEVLLELWRKRTAYDPARGSWRTFAEPVVANRLVSLTRSLNSAKSGHRREEPLETARSLTAPRERHDLRIEVWRVLDRVAPFDRTVALCLIAHSATETARKLGVSRATVYRAIERLRAAFEQAGLAPWRHDERHPHRASCRA